MKVVVFGSNGNIGQRVVKILLAEGHAVTAFVHGQSPFKPIDKLKIVIGDIHDLASVQEALKNNDAVLSTLGSWGTKSKDILSSGMANIIPEMEKTGIKRIVTLTGAGATYKNDSNFSMLSKISRRFLLIAAKPILTDGEKHIELLQKSTLDWTVIRSPIMKNYKEKNQFLLTVKNPLPWETINRDNVAEAMVTQLSDTTWINKSPFVRSV